jgi:hypothetical protein
MILCGARADLRAYCAATGWKSRDFKKTSQNGKKAFDSPKPPPYNPLQDEGGGCFWRLTNSPLSLTAGFDLEVEFGGFK